ncbi:DUF4265 domain-containing protein [Paenibacillus rhizophilus]|uniref:DUF4265 domain-containing protein n=1 Tax=Paenibacillus rhizophilus TaxID=1850366 RepID=A0A3N9P6W0_9BACL|nr:DUF4265 domain-containing protein [Paenibacillus rhizophilus]RQW11170.1 DUF4265 domain-containing protein [Paenibacillus rhizophilus]
MPEFMEVQLCFDEAGREIEILEVTRIGENEYRIEETPVFRPELSLGDIIKVKEERGVCHYVETVRKSDYRKVVRLLSREAARSPELAAFRERVLSRNGKWETVFGGVLIIHVPKEAEQPLKAELEAIARAYGI